MNRAGAGGSSGRVCYVDPDDERAAPTVDALSDVGFAVDRVGSYETASECLAADGVDCLVTEQQLPDGTGLELLRAVRDGTAGGSASLPVILYTGDGDEQLASEAVSAGVTDYVPRNPPEKQRGALADAVAAALDDPDRRFAAVTEQLKDRAMDEAPVGITIADACRRDTPLIYVNDAFADLTGYPEAASLGRNCNFLQGPDSGEEPVVEMARAIDAGESTSVELVNYTQEGEPFWNRVTIAPVHDDAGEVTHYVGFQRDVTDRVEAEREARRQAETATREREKVQSLLDRLDGLVTDVTTALLHADTRTAVERSVCDRLVESEEYAVAWVAERDPATDAIAPSTWAGVTDAPAGDVADDADDPVARAARTGELVVVHDADLPGRYAGLGVGALAAVPLSYGDVTYGVLAVGVEPAATLSSAERGVLSAVGRSTAMALHALASQQLLGSDEVIELAFSLSGEEPFVVGLSEELDCTFEHAGTVTREDGATTFFFETDADPDRVGDAVAAHPGVTDWAPVTRRERDGAGGSETAAGARGERETAGEADDRWIVEFAVDASPLFDVVLDRGGRITALSADGGTGEVTVEIPPDAQPREVVEAVENRVAGADLSAYREHERPAQTRQDVRARIDDRLTDRQSTALRTAIVGGFFEWPRETTGEDLAASMDIGRSTFHQHLRAAQRKVFEELYQ